MTDTGKGVSNRPQEKEEVDKNEICANPNVLSSSPLDAKAPDKEEVVLSASVVTLEDTSVEPEVAEKRTNGNELQETSLQTPLEETSSRTTVVREDMTELSSQNVVTKPNTSSKDHLNTELAVLDDKDHASSSDSPPPPIDSEEEKGDLPKEKDGSQDVVLSNTLSRDECSERLTPGKETVTPSSEKNDRVEGGLERKQERESPSPVETKETQKTTAKEVEQVAVSPSSDLNIERSNEEASETTVSALKETDPSKTPLADQETVVVVSKKLEDTQAAVNDMKASVPEAGGSTLRWADVYDASDSGEEGEEEKLEDTPLEKEAANDDACVRENQEEKNKNKRSSKEVATGKYQVKKGVLLDQQDPRSPSSSPTKGTTNIYGGIDNVEKAVAEDELRPLKPSRDRWVPHSKERELSFVVNADKRAEQRADRERLLVRGMLNRLTPETYLTLGNELQHAFRSALEVNVQPLANLFFDKAVSEPAYAALWGEACRKFCELPDPSRPQAEAMALRCVRFRDLTLQQCQEAFERILREYEEPELDLRMLSMDEREEAEEEIAKCRHLQIGTLHFIAELFSRGLVVERVMHHCLQRLLSVKNAESIFRDRCLEAVCTLLRVCGRALDREEARDYVDNYFARLEMWSKRKMVTTRIRFMIEDICLLRENGWLERRRHRASVKAPGASGGGVGHHQSESAAAALAAPEIGIVGTTGAAAEARREKQLQVARKMRKESAALIRELISHGDVREAVEDVLLLKSPQLHHLLVREAVRFATECASQKNRNLVGRFLSLLYERGMCTPGDYEAGFLAVLEELAEIEVDVPFATRYAAHIIGHALRSRVLRMNYLQELSAGDLAPDLDSVLRSQICTLVSDAVVDLM